jgi:hypothetical protein
VQGERRCRRCEANKSRACAFCGAYGRLTKEHVWPQWLQTIAGPLHPERASISSGFWQENDGAFREAQAVRVDQPGSILKRTARAVCRDCNGGWMSQLEQQTKPHLESLVGATTTNTGLPIQPDVAALLATWAIKTAWMNELGNRGEPATSAAMRKFLYEHLLPPEFSVVWLAKHVGRFDFDSRCAVVGLTDEPGPYTRADLRMAQVTALTFRGICLLAFTVDGWGVRSPTKPTEQWLQLWPAQQRLWFPPPRVVSDDDINIAVVKQTPWLNLPPATGFIRDVRGPVNVRRN